MAKRGRPSIYTPELAAEICTLLAGGQSLRSICQGEDKPAISSVILWLSQKQDFLAQYQRARESWAEREFERLMEIADTPERGVIVTTKADGSQEVREADMIEHRKLQVTTRMWALARMAPKRYGEWVQKQAEGEGTRTIQLVVVQAGAPLAFEPSSKVLDITHYVRR